MQSQILILVILLLSSLTLSAAQAQENPAYPGGFTLMPLDPEPVRLLSMTVDATIWDNGQQAIAEVQAVYRVHNRDKKEDHALTVAIPGYPATKPAPEPLALSLGGNQLDLRPGNQQWWLAEVMLKADERRNLVLTYSYPLGSGPFVRWTYPVDVTANSWPGRLESARVTLAFSEPPNPQSWLSLTPEDYLLTAESVTWSYDAEDPQEPIDFVLMRPSVWTDVRQARQAAASANATAQDHLALGDTYAQLAINSSDPAIFERYFPLTVAAYSQAQTLAPEDPTAYLALANLYRTRAEIDQPPDPTYVSLAVNQLAGALEHGAQDPTIAASVATDFANLIARARLQGEFDTARTYLRRLEQLAANSQVAIDSAQLEEERRRLAIDEATFALRSQGSGPARHVLTESFGDDIIQPPIGRFARLTNLVIDTRTQPGERSIAITAAPRAGGTALIEELYESLTASNVASVTLRSTEPGYLQVVLPFQNDSELIQRQQTLASAVPADPEWKLLSATLLPQGLSWDRYEERWRTIEQYREDVSLVAAVAGLGGEALALEQAADALDTQDPLNVLLAEIWRAEADSWRRLAENNRARFHLTMIPRPGGPIQQSWSLDPGEQATMTGRAVQYNVQLILLTVGGIYALAILLTGLVWRLTRRSSPKNA